MKFKTWTAGVAVLTLAAAPAFADESLSQFSYDEFVQAVDCCSSGCDSLDCGDACGGCGSRVAGGGLLSGIGPGVLEGLSLSRILGINGIDIGGWTQLGYHDNATLLTGNGSGGSFNDRPDRINLHQQYFYLGKEADGSNGLDFGFRADFIYGIDGQDTQAFGNPAGSFDEGWDNGNYGWAIPQLYAEMAVGDLSVIVGKFYTLVGYEVVTAPDNFFYSHALTQYNSEPFTHTGVLTTYTGFENITFYGGWTLGWDTGFDNLNSGNSWLGGFSANLSDSVTLTYINTYGNFGDINQGGDSDYSHSIVLDTVVTENLRYVFQTDYLKVDTETADEDLGINQYLIYQYNDILSFGSRIEWWRRNQVSHYEYTSGVNIKLLDNLVIRPEYRKDWIPATGYDQDIVGSDLILTY